MEYILNIEVIFLNMLKIRNDRPFGQTTRARRDRNLRGEGGKLRVRTGNFRPAN
jgi:hypothetical protein